MAKILIVDDDPAGQRLIKYMLTSEKHEVIAASNGIQGLQLTSQQSPDLVILDVMLPGLDGFEVCRRLRTGAKTSGMPIIMLSGKTQASDRDTGIKMGANEYFIKPVDRQQLVATVNRLLNESLQGKKQKQARILTFIGARGGAGTSTVTTNVSVALEKTGHSTILVDMNPSYSALAEMIGLNAERSITGLFKGAPGAIDAGELKSLLIQHSSGVKLLWAESYPDESDIYNTTHVKLLFDKLNSLADFIIVDISASPSENAITTLNLADSVILVTGAGKESLEKIGTSITRLTRFGINQDKMILLIVDKTGTGSNSDLISKDVIGGIPVFGVIHFCENECSAAEAESIPVILNAPASQIAEDIKSLASRIAQVK